MSNFSSVSHLSLNLHKLAESWSKDLLSLMDLSFTALGTSAYQKNHIR